MSAMASPHMSIAPVFFIGLPKSGSTTFHELMHSLDVPSFHVGGGGHLDQPKLSLPLRQRARDVCMHGQPTQPSPMYIPALQLIGDANMYCMATRSGYRAFADDPWPLLWPYVEEAVPDSKFVLWEREPAQWAASAVRYFDDDIDWDWLRLFYGACNMSVAYEQHLETVAQTHYAAVRTHFLGDDAPAERRARLLIVDYADKHAGKRVCEFALGAGATRCADIERMPRALPEKWLEGPDAERVKMPLGKPGQIATFGECVREFEGIIGGAARRTELMSRAFITGGISMMPGIICRNGTANLRPCPSPRPPHSAGKVARTTPHTHDDRL